MLLIACFPWTNSAFIQGGNGKYCATHATLAVGSPISFATCNMNDPKQRSWFFFISEPRSPILICLTNNLCEEMDHKGESFLAKKDFKNPSQQFTHLGNDLYMNGRHGSDLCVTISESDNSNIALKSTLKRCDPKNPMQKFVFIE